MKFSVIATIHAVLTEKQMAQQRELLEIGKPCSVQEQQLVKDTSEALQRTNQALIWLNQQRCE